MEQWNGRTMVGMAEHLNVHVTLKLNYSLKKLVTKLCVGGNNFLLLATFSLCCGNFILAATVFFLLR